MKRPYIKPELYHWSKLASCFVNRLAKKNCYIITSIFHYTDTHLNKPVIILYKHMDKRGYINTFIMCWVIKRAIHEFGELCQNAWRLLFTAHDFRKKKKCCQHQNRRYISSFKCWLNIVKILNLLKIAQRLFDRLVMPPGLFGQ